MTDKTKNVEDVKRPQMPKKKPIKDRSKNNVTKEGGLRYRVQFDMGYKGDPGVKNHDKSMTVPDLNLTIGQLLEEHVRGADGSIVQKKPLYFDITIPNITDITDVYEYEKYLAETLKSTREFIENEIREKEEENEDPDSDGSGGNRQTSILDEDQQTE